MGSGLSASLGLKSSDEEGNGYCYSYPALEDIPESCLALIIMYLDPEEICRMAELNHSFRRASSADFVWESKLPENYEILVNKLFNENPKGQKKKDIYTKLCRPILFARATKEVWLDKKQGGICVSVSWKALAITGIHDRRYWNHISTLESRFHSVAYLHQIWWLEAEGDVEFPFRRGTYSLFFRLKLGLGESSKGFDRRQSVRGWDIKPVQFHLSTSDGQNSTSQSYLNDEHGKWVKYCVGDFVVQDSSKPTKISFSMTQIDCTHSKSGLCLDSVLILPKSSGL